MVQRDAWRMIRRLVLAAGITTPVGSHSFRATGITAYLANGGARDGTSTGLDYVETPTSPM
jgi:integrase